MIAAQRREHLLAGDVGQVQVEQDHVGVQLARQRHAAGALARDVQAEVTGEPEYLLDQPDVGRVVLDVEHRDGGTQALGRGVLGPQSGNRRIDPVGAPRRELPGVGDRQLERHRGAHALLGGEHQLAAHRLDQTAGQRQAETGALDPTAGGVKPLEGGEELGDRILGDAVAGVGDLDPHRPVLDTPGADHDIAAAAVVLDGVGDQVQQYLDQALAVGLDVEADVDRPLPHAHGGRRGRRADQRLGLREHVGHLDRLEGETQVAALDPREVEQIVDDRQQVPAGAEHLGERLALALLDQVAIEQLAEAEDRVQWRAQLVADT